MQILVFIFIAAQIILGLYLLLPALYGLTALLMPVAEHDMLGREGNEPVDNTEKGIACIITAYKEKEFAFLLIDSLLRQNYSNFHIWLVADRAEPALQDLKHEKLTIIYPPAPLDSKVKSIQAALSMVNVQEYPYTLVLDPDNLAHPGLLDSINQKACAGFTAIQARRTAKNLDTTFACLDAGSDDYYHVTQRLAPFRLGSSATIAGSGMAIDTGLYSSILAEISEKHEAGAVIVAEDKLLQNRLVELGHIIAYAPEALVYDEKVGSAAQVQRQRTRWINSWFSFFREAWKLVFQGVTEGSSNKLLFGLMISTPPLFLMVVSAVLMLATGMLVSPVTSLYLAGTLVVFVLNFFVSLFVARSDFKIWKSLFLAPLFIFRQLLAMLRLRRANDSFMATTHVNRLSIDEVMQAEAELQAPVKSEELI